MKGMLHNTQKPQITLTEARKVLGTTGKGLSDEAVKRLIAQVDVLTDILVAHVNDSNIQSCIDISTTKPHTDN